MSMSNYLEDAVLKHILRGTQLAQPSGLTVALFTVAPTEVGGGTEVTGGGYTRATLGASPFTVSGTSPTQAVNAADITFAQASASWGSVVAFGIFDTAATPNMLFWGMTKNPSGTDTSFTVNNGDTFKFPAGSLTITLD